MLKSRERNYPTTEASRLPIKLLPIADLVFGFGSLVFDSGFLVFIECDLLEM